MLLERATQWFRVCKFKKTIVVGQQIFTVFLKKYLNFHTFFCLPTTYQLFPTLSRNNLPYPTQSPTTTDRSQKLYSNFSISRLSQFEQKFRASSLSPFRVDCNCEVHFLCGCLLKSCEGNGGCRVSTSRRDMPPKMRVN